MEHFVKFFRHATLITAVQEQFIELKLTNTIFVIISLISHMYHKHLLQLYSKQLLNKWFTKHFTVFYHS